MNREMSGGRKRVIIDPEQIVKWIKLMSFFSVYATETQLHYQKKFTSCINKLKQTNYLKEIKSFDPCVKNYVVDKNILKAMPNDVPLFIAYKNEKNLDTLLELSKPFDFIRKPNTINYDWSAARVGDEGEYRISNVLIESDKVTPKVFLLSFFIYPSISRT